VTTSDRILAAATELLAASATGDISTRAVCEAAGVTQPVLYRAFGDKDGLLAAVANSVWEGYLTSKRAAQPSADALADLTAGWDAHTEFALANPHAYRLIFGTGLRGSSHAAREAMALLEAILERLARQGRLRVDPATAATIVMAANTGIALGLLTQPQLFPDAAASATVRDATLRAILTEAPHHPAHAAAATLRAHLPHTTAFTQAESALCDEWLQRFQHIDTKEHHD